jgi:hypothetical protein
MKVFAALKEDVHEGWVWVQDETLLRRTVVRITNRSNGMTTHCEALPIDSNFLKIYNANGRRKIKTGERSIVMGAWYRASLGGITTNYDHALEISICSSWFGTFCASVNHPQVGVRQSAWLGGIGLLLGTIGLLLGLAALS